MPANIVRAPEKFQIDTGTFSVFLAGSIEMGKAVDWQKQFEKHFSSISNLLIINPRRLDWDSSWKDGCPQMVEQINWELDSLEKANLVALYFDPETNAPISLEEMGLCLGRKQNLSVFCTQKFYRFTNVEITCKKYGVKVFQNEKDWYQDIAIKIAQGVK